ncbi:hypothetical protein [Lichenicoccus sp.]|uniref:hypothetical protein n=1 Tax=Lichenicoccus sp. TaxID=2781899 RepID=UPI003D134D15
MVALRFELACRLDRLGRDDEARAAYLAVLALDMRHGAALRQLAALLARGGFTSAARTVLAQAAPEDVAARAMLGHLLRDAGEHVPARAAYEAALRVDPLCAEAHQGMSYLVEGEAAERHRAAGFAGRALTRRPYRGAGRPVAVLRLVSSRGGNVPTEQLLDDRVFAVHTLVADQAEPSVVLPPHALVLNAIGDAELCGAALDAAERMLAGHCAPVFNPLDAVRATTRVGNAMRLGRLENVVAPRMSTLPRAALRDGVPGFGFPLLLRSPGFHTGAHFVRIEDAAALAAGVAMLPGEALTAIEPLDARGADGFARKYRVMVVGGALLPLHLAIAPDWKVHHFTAGMEARPEHRAEEAAFLADMASVLGRPAMDTLGRIAEVLGLDYGGIDFGLNARGKVLLFEANATMTVARPRAGSIWEYRAAAAEAVIASTRRLLLRKASAAA